MRATRSVICDCLLSELGWMAVLLPIPRQLGLDEQVIVAVVFRLHDSATIRCIKSNVSVGTWFLSILWIVYI